MATFKIFTVIVVIFSIISGVLSILLGGNFPIEENRIAIIDKKNNQLQCIVSGYYPMIMSSEGMFPHWSENIVITFRSKILFVKKDRVELHYDKDFSVQYDKIKSGIIIIDSSKHVITLLLKYNTSYSWCKINGDFPFKFKD